MFWQLVQEAHAPVQLDEVCEVNDWRLVESVVVVLAIEDVDPVDPLNVFELVVDLVVPFGVVVVVVDRALFCPELPAAVVVVIDKADRLEMLPPLPAVTVIV